MRIGVDVLTPGSQLRHERGLGEAGQIARLAEVALRRHHDRDEVLRRQHPAHQEQPLRLDRQLLEAADRQALARLADLAEDERELHRHGIDVDPVVELDVAVDRDAVEAHDHRGDSALDVVDHLLERFSEQVAPWAGTVLDKSAWIDSWGGESRRHILVPTAGHWSPSASVQQSVTPSWPGLQVLATRGTKLVARA